MEAGEGRGAARAGSTRCSYTAAEGLRALAVLLSPVHAEGDRAKLWTALGAEGALGALAPAAARRRATGAQLPAGDAQVALEAAVPADREPEAGARVTHRRTAFARGARRAAGRSAGLTYPPLPEALARAGLRQPHPPRDRGRRRGRSTTASSSTARRASASAASCRSAPTSPTSRWSAGCRGARAARARGGGAASERGARARRGGRASTSPRRDRRARARSRGCGRSARPGSTSSAPARTGRAAQIRVLRGAHRDRQAARARAADPRPRRARRGRRELLRVGAPERTVFHCFSGDAALARARAPTTAGTCPSPARSRSRTPSRCARRSRSPRAA